MADFRLVKTYHKPYRLFTDPYVVNVGNICSAVNKEDNIRWLTKNMDFCPRVEDCKFNSMNSEWSAWECFIKNYEISYDSFLSFQHYSKVLDLTTVRDVPYHDTTQVEDSFGEKYRAAKSLDEFGYGEIDSYLSRYDVIVGNQYPCSILLSIKSNMTIPLQDVLQQYRNILHNFNDSLFTEARFVEYCNQPYQYWRGGPLIAPRTVFQRLFKFTIDFEHAFLDSKSYANESIYVLRDGRGNSYIGEMVIGFAIYCYIEDCKKQGQKIGYCRMLTDSQVIYGNTRQ